MSYTKRAFALCLLLLLAALAPLASALPVAPENAVCDPLAAQGASGTCRGAVEAAQEVDNIEPEHAAEDVEHAVVDHFLGGVCSDQDETCADANETLATDPTTVPGDAKDAACAPRPGTCAGAIEAVEEVDNVDPDHAPEDVEHAARDHLLAGACSDQPETDTTCADVNTTLATDPFAVIGGIRGAACAARPGTCAGVDDAADEEIDPEHAADDLSHAVLDHFYPAFCSDNPDACVEANASILTAEYLRAGNGPLVVTEPGAIHTTSPVAISFATVLPTHGKVGPTFLVQAAPAGESTWTNLSEVRCPGTHARVCEFSWDDAAEGAYIVRVLYHSEDTCKLEQCAISPAFVVDDTKPATRVGALASTQSEPSFAVPYVLTDADAETVTTLEYSIDDGDFTAWPVESMNGSFAFTAVREGLYKFRTVGVDRAGNAEAAKLGWEAATRVGGDFPAGRLVVLDIARPGFVAVGDAFRYDLTALHGDDGTASPYARIEALLDGAVVAEALAGPDGVAQMAFTRGDVAVANYSFRVTHEGELPTAVSSYELVAQAIWTTIVPSVSSVERASLFENAGAPFGIVYCVSFAHGAHAPAPGTLIDVEVVGSGEYNVGATGEDGCLDIDIVEDVIGVYDYWANASLLTEDGVLLKAAVADTPSLTFTRVDLTIDVADDFIPIGGSTVFTVCGVFAHDGSLGAQGAVVNVVDERGDALETPTLGAAGCVDAAHVFDAVYDGIVSAELVSTPQGVTLELAPTPVGRMIATEARVGTVTLDDAFVNVGDAISYTIPLTWAHDGTNITDGTLSVSPEGQAASTCEVAAGLATCAVARAQPQASSFPITVATPEGVSRIQNGSAATPSAVWTRVVATGSVADVYLPLGGAAQVTYGAKYAHDLSAVPTFTVRVTTDCGDDKQVVGAAGVASTTIAHAAFCDTAVRAVSVAAAGGITAQDPATLTIAPRVVWTQVKFTVEADDDFASIGQPVALTGTAVYNGTTDRVNGTIDIVDAAGVVIGTTTVSNGVFSTSVTKSVAYAGALAVDLVSDLQGVDLQLPASVPVVWTDILLTVGVDDAFVTIGDDVVVSGTATYLVDGANVPSGALDILDADGSSVGTASIADGAWSATVDKAEAYSAPLRATLTSSANDVAAADVSTGDVTWTRILLTRDAAADTFVNVGDAVAYLLNATYAHGGVVTAATIEARAANGTVLGSCQVASGDCALTVTSPDSTRQALDLVVVSAHSDVTTLEDALQTETLTWTRLLVQKAALRSVASAGSGAGVHVTVRYEHDGSLVQNALVTLSNFTGGDQAAFTNASGVAVIPAIEDSIGQRDILVSARVPAQAIGSHIVAGGAKMPLRWTAIGFRAFTYDVVPSGYQDGNPIFPVGTTVQACTVAEAVDTQSLVSSAQVLLRGASRATDAAGKVCITIVKASAERDVRVTAHGLEATIDGASITSTVDRTVTLLFRENP